MSRTPEGHLCQACMLAPATHTKVISSGKGKPTRVQYRCTSCFRGVRPSWFSMVDPRMAKA
jgi:hypothetical protein